MKKILFSAIKKNSIVRVYGFYVELSQGTYIIGARKEGDSIDFIQVDPETVQLEIYRNMRLGEKKR